VSVFYQKFERHAHGEGLKGHATHYCAGCGHGLVHKYIAEAIADQEERTDAQKEVLTQSLAAVREQMEMAELLGYGDEREIKRIYRALAKLDGASTMNDQTARTAFNDIREAFSKL